MLLFIVIPENPEFNEACFNTSHVTLYPDGSTVLVPGETCFNTSHVTLYRKPSVKSFILNRFQYITCYSLSLGKIGYSCGTVVSIHHMLLFIREWAGKLAPAINKFQYITCYSLSISRLGLRNWKQVSIHHMLLFIPLLRFRIVVSTLVSIHHMLLFIGNVTTNPDGSYSFQYITCYSLSILRIHAQPRI